MNDGFIFYASFYEALAELEPDDRLAVYDAICRYGLMGEEPEQAGIVKAIFKLVKPNIDANARKREAGRKGGKANTKQDGSKTKQSGSKLKQNAEIVEANEECRRENIEGKKENEDNIPLYPPSGGKKHYSPNEDLDIAIRQFVDHRKKLRKPMTDHAIDLFVKKLARLADTDEGKIELINTAIEHGWQTVYPPNQKTTKIADQSIWDSWKDL